MGVITFSDSKARKSWWSEGPAAELARQAEKLEASAKPTSPTIPVGWDERDAKGV